MKTCIIIIPAYKPSIKLKELIQNLQQEWVSKIVCIDDGSGKEFAEIFCEIERIENVCVLKHAINMGKGRALKTAFNYIMNELPDNDMVITVDADGQHTLEAIDKVYHAFCGNNHMILGKREFTNTNSKKKIPFRSRFGNNLTRWVFNFLCNVNVSDTQTGLRAIPMTILPYLIEVPGERYEYETNCLLWCKDNSIELKEVEIETVYENNNESSHFNPLGDSLKIYKVIFKYLCSSGLSVVVDYAVFFTLTNYTNNVFLLTYSGRICSSIINFIINKKVVFKTTGKVWYQGIKYFLLVLLSGTISAIAVSGFQMVISENLVIAKVIVEIILFFFNFYIQKNFIFAKGKDNSNKE